jgi:ribosome-interacting GTPase 1
MTTMQKIAEIEAEIEKTQKNKATNYHMGILKAKLAKLKREMIDASSKGKNGGTGEGF